MNLPRRTRVWRLPSGDAVLVWAKDVEALRRDVIEYGNVILIRDPHGDVYDRVAPDSAEAKAVAPAARRLG